MLREFVRRRVDAPERLFVLHAVLSRSLASALLPELSVDFLELCREPFDFLLSIFRRNAADERADEPDELPEHDEVDDRLVVHLESVEVDVEVAVKLQVRVGDEHLRGVLRRSCGFCERS